MEIKILERITNRVHGNSVLHFEEGDVKEIHDDLAQSLVDEGKAEPVAKVQRKTHSDAQGKGK